jgi:PEP-CTERM motif
MKNVVLAATLAAAIFGVASANAATVLTFTFSADGNSAVASFNSSGAGLSFSDLYTFTLPAGFASTSLTSAAVNGTTDTAFTSVLLNSLVLTTNSSGAIDEKSLLNVPVPAGPNTLTVNGTSGGLYSYGGNISFTKTLPVPEPASWALMIAGFGGLGAALRSKRRMARTGIAA